MTLLSFLRKNTCLGGKIFILQDFFLEGGGGEGREIPLGEGRLTK